MRISRFLPHARLLATCTLLVALVAGCDNEELLTPDPPPTGEMFARYVAIGNSITAGFQSGGINQSLQADAYPVLLAEQMGTTFFIPELKDPGCPPPLARIFPTPQTIMPSVECALRDTPLPPFVSNVAVPGAEVVDVLNNLHDDSNANTLTSLILGGRTQLDAALEVDPTFVSVWIGNNDVLGAALAGDPQRITDAADFRERYGQILDGLDEAGSLQGGLLVSVADVTAIPGLSQGQQYFGVANQAPPGLLPDNFQVADNCAPATATLIPFQYGAGAIGLARGLDQFLASLEQQAGTDLGDPPNVEIDCSNNVTFGDVYHPLIEQYLGSLESNGVLTSEQRQAAEAELKAGVAGVAHISILTTEEIDALEDAVTGFNAYIEAQADERGWAYLNINALFEANAQMIPSFPALVDDPTTPDVDESAMPFGPLFSLDGVHPSSQAHRLVTDAAIAAINAQYGTSIPALAN